MIFATHPRRLLVAAIAFVAVACAGRPATTAPPERAPDTRPGAEAVALAVEGYVFHGSDPADPSRPAVRPQKWAGTGFWITDELLVTNAHVAARAARVVATGADGRVYAFDRIVALAPQIDTALLRMKAADTPAQAQRTTPLLPLPADPRGALREKPVLSVGNALDLGLSYLRGRILDVVHLPTGPAERIAIRGLSGPGASGGPVYSDDGAAIVGVTHAGSGDHTLALAIPSWRVTEVVSRHLSAEGVPLTALFDADEPPLARFDAERSVCLAGRSHLRFDITALGSADLVVHLRATDRDHAITPSGRLGELRYLIAQRRQGGHEALVSWQGMVEGPRMLAAQSLSADGHYTVLVGNPTDEAVCLHAAVGRVEWEARI